MDRNENVVRPARPMNRKRKKVCIFCADKVEFIDYKDTAKLRKFISERMIKSKKASEKSDAFLLSYKLPSISRSRRAEELPDVRA